ncbi:MAG: twin-arginine translocase subunit TatC [Chitinophagales bacterium]
MSNQSEMSFIEHLEELRWHIARSLGAIGLFAIVAFLAKSFVFDILLFGPKESWFPTYVGFCNASHYFGFGDSWCFSPKPFDIIVTDPMAQFLSHIKVSIVIGLILGFPYIFYEIWKFIAPALYETEKKYTKGIVFISSVLFLMGVSFGYYVLCPFSLNFFASYTVSSEVTNTWRLTAYVSLIATLVLASGVMFELPMAVYFLSKVGIATPESMREYRKHAFVAILLLSAIITPPDLISQLLVGCPVYLLYEMSIFISARVQKKELALEKAEEGKLNR